jgi:hypothetical protein
VTNGQVEHAAACAICRDTEWAVQHAQEKERSHFAELGRGMGHGGVVRMVENKHVIVGAEGGRPFKL